MHQKIQRFEDMQIWQDSQDFAVAVYDATKQFPGSERFAITDQLRRAASSISANIAEGFGRSSQKDMLHFYTIGYGSLLETKNFIYLARKLDYIDEILSDKLIEDSEALQKQFNAIKKYFDSRE